MHILREGKVECHCQGEGIKVGIIGHRWSLKQLDKFSV